MEQAIYEKKFEDFKDLSSRLLDIEMELIKTGCSLPNCHQRTWTIESSQTYDPSHSENLSL